ncbi:MAG: 2-oxo acid dehydrogenase subunit E2 [Marinilabiliaceae bacterium]|jgi:pyruvate dehydrogenase E2 component (dihydrolipoamide acetyltransferase)|nr:2-oxo acid dehydrogenase subunit E2 [Marinilabiliaceae bacterium]
MSDINFNTDWRVVASTIYNKPVDSKMLGSVEVDVTDLEKYITNKRKEGLKITPTHIFTLIFARGLKFEVPELNTYVRRGRIVHKESVDAMISVMIQRDEMSSVKVPSAEFMTLSELSEFLSEKIKETRSGEENREMRKKGMLARIPWPFRRWFYKLIKLITISWGYSFAGISANNYGSFVVANIGTVGLDVGYPALFPTSNVAIVFTMGGIYKKPAVVNDQIVPRRLMNLSVAMDHRVVDASHGGRLFRYVKRMIQTPELLERKPE